MGSGLGLGLVWTFPYGTILRFGPCAGPVSIGVNESVLVLVNMRVNFNCTFQIQEMFNLTKEKLEETEQTLEDTSNRLVDTKKTLVKTRVDRDEQKFLVSQHIKSEAKLHSQATQVKAMLLCLHVKKKDAKTSFDFPRSRCIHIVLNSIHVQ